MENYINEITEEKLKLFEDICGLEDTVALKKAKSLINCISGIDAYVVYADCLNESELLGLKTALSKLLEYASLDIARIGKENNENQIFSIKEWNDASEKRKLSIISFAAAAMKYSDIKEESFEDVFKLFDSETLEWLKNNSPYENIREYLACH